MSGGRFFMSTSHSSAPLRSDVTLIEFDDEAVGLAVREGSGYRFFAAVPALRGIDGRFFRSLKQLRQAAAPRAGRDRMRRVPRAAPWSLAAA